MCAANDADSDGMPSAQPGSSVEEVFMFDELIRRWWILAARGLVAIVFGVAALMAPDQTLTFLVGTFGVFAIADGFFAIGAGLSINWLSLFLEGVFGAAIGLLTFFYPPAAPLMFTQLIVAWATVTGILELIGAGRLIVMKGGPSLVSEWLLAGLGVLSLALAGVLAFGTAADSAAIIATVGGYALASGPLFVLLALQIREWQPTVAGMMRIAA
jgi:uncharacterized membrane protein HdeD (DUF308 family)